MGMLMDREEVEKKLAVFGLRGLQDFITLFDILEREGISIKDVRNFMLFVKEGQERRKADIVKITEKRMERWNKNTRRCPTCMMPLMARPINIPTGKGNREGYTSHWYCQEESCNFEEYSYENFREIYSKIMED